MEKFGFVLPDGTLNPNVVKRVEPLLEGASACKFTVEVDEMEQTFIFKPVASPEPIELEIWFHRKFLPHLPGVRVPRLLDYRIDRDKDVFWMIMEYLGHLQHRFDVDAKRRAVEIAVMWHTLPPELLPERQARFLPLVDEVASTISVNWPEYEQAMRQLGLRDNVIRRFHELLASVPGILPEEYVVSHGDFHPRNIDVSGESPIILDWEYLQWNSVYWDLYLCIDRAMPLYRIQTDAASRLSVLDAYVRARQRTGWEPRSDFILRYHWFAAVYSVYVMPLLIKDLIMNKFPRDALAEEARELSSIVNDCMAYLDGWKGR